MRSAVAWSSLSPSARRRADVDCRFHDLRHLAGTLNAQAGATIKEAMRRLGHSTPDAALRYQHAVDERDGAIAGAVDEIIQDGSNRARHAHGADEGRTEDDEIPLQ